MEGHRHSEGGHMMPEPCHVIIINTNPNSISEIMGF